MSIKDQLYGTVPRSEYAMIKCRACPAVYRWGRKHLWQSACPVCGAIDFNPQEVARSDYSSWLDKIGTTKNMEALQKALWNPRKIE